MLTAKLSDGRVISVAGHDNLSYLKWLRSRYTFYCRLCGEKVILKVGTKKIPHFAHERDSFCTDYYEPESEYHLHGKLQLFEWLRRENASPQLEVYFPRIRRRADIVFHYGGKKYCLEFQCADLPEEEFIQRTKGYRSLSLYPLWILGGKNIQRKSSQKFAISAFQYLFLQMTHGDNLYLPAFCPDRNELIFLTNILPVSSRTALAGLTIKPLRKACISDMFMPPSAFKFSVRKWREEMGRFKTTFLRNKTLFNSEFVKELYSLSVHPQLLPPYVGIPLSLNPVIEESPFIWQAYVYLDCLFGKKEGEKFSFADAYLSLLKRVRKKHLHLRHLPNIKKGLLPFLLADYLQVLTAEGILNREGKDGFLITNDMVPFRTLAESAREEARFYSKFSFRKSFEGQDIFE